MSADRQRSLGDFLKHMDQKVEKAPLLPKAVGIAAIAGVVAAACGPATPTETQSPTDPGRPTDTAPIPTSTLNAPVGNETETPIIAQKREAVLPEDVKNVEPSLLIGSGEVKVSVYPDNSTEEMKKSIDDRYAGILRKFGTQVKVYFNQDTDPNVGSTSWILFPIDAEGKLIHSVSSYGESTVPAPFQPSDYPIIYNASLDAVGEYAKFEVPGGGVPGVIWTGPDRDHRLAQFVADRVTLSDGTTYDQKALNYLSYVEDNNSWEEIAGMADLLSTPEAPKFDFSSSVNPDKIKIMQEYFIGLPDLLTNNSEQFGFTAVSADVFIVSYRLVNEGSGTSMYAELIHKNSLIKVKVDYVTLQNSSGYVRFETSELTPAEASKVSRTLEKSFSNINNFSGDYIGDNNGGLSLVAINSGDEEKKCLQRIGYTQVCTYKSSLDEVSSQELIDMFNNALVPITDNQFEKFAQPENINPLLSSQGQRTVIRLTVR